MRISDLISDVCSSDLQAQFPDNQGRVEWAVAWPVEADEEEGLRSFYCNTVPTPEGGTHETGLRAGLRRSLLAYGELVGNRKAGQTTAEEVIRAEKRRGGQKCAGRVSNGWGRKQ